MVGVVLVERVTSDGGDNAHTSAEILGVHRTKESPKISPRVLSNSSILACTRTFPLCLLFHSSSDTCDDLNTSGELKRCQELGQSFSQGGQKAHQELWLFPGCTGTSCSPPGLRWPGAHRSTLWANNETLKLAVGVKGSCSHRFAPGGFQLPPGSTPTNLWSQPGRLSIQKDMLTGPGQHSR